MGGENILKEYSRLFAATLVCCMVAVSIPVVFAQPPGRPVGPRQEGHSIYVNSQEMYFNTIVPVLSIGDGGKGLPWNGHNQGSFQQLYPTGGPAGGPATDYGPGDPGYRGGRWWIDNPVMGIVGEQDEYDTYFLCPLLGPAMENP